MAGVKGKYMPLSEANVSPLMVSSYDGQYLCVSSSSAAPGSASSCSSSSSSSAAAFNNNADSNNRDARFSMGNYLGGGIAGVVYEAYDREYVRNVAIKILNPVGYKMCSPAALRRGEIIKKGVPIVGNVRGMTLENVYWVSVPNRRDLIACYVDGRNATSTSSAMMMGMNVSNNSTSPAAMLRELTLEMCVSLWLLDADLDDVVQNQRFASEDPVNDHHNSCRRVTARTTTRTMIAGQMREERKEDDSDSLDVDEEELMMDATHALAREEEIKVGDVVYTIPKMPAKYKSFLQSRKTIYREIAHMHKLTGNSVSGQVGGGHENVLKLYDVLEFVQPSKSTIFLVLELAYGGELFDRIRSDNGVEESVARGYFKQLLSGVLYCHQLGIVHRDLKPENLLLSESDVLKIADFGLSAHFIAAVSGSAQDDSSLMALGSSNYQPEMDGESGIMTPARFRRLNSIVGSPHYVAPEVLQNARYGYEGRKADMWSIGVILYGLLVGNLPFGKELPTCPRYLKFCEWIRSLPCEPLTGKLMFDMDIFNAGPARVLSSANDPSFPQQDDFAKAQQQQIRMAQVLPSYQPTPAMIHSSSLWSGVPTPTKPPASAMSLQSNNNEAGNSALQSGAGGRRGSRVVTFPGWLFPAKLSPQAVFLLASLLHPDPAKRISCEDAYKSNWVMDPMY
uniref:non-specific serine/threonine protein kinase n=1 Tax=Globisporangium ultimum (strain ATCC 200006 / CBS 805.95 / DAOM BR144) TaxID=431595 RepID=K3WVB6_GLOUD